MEQETFIGKVQVKQRVVIPKVIYDILKLKSTDKIRVTITKVEK